jgi:hypothetical protein
VRACGAITRNVRPNVRHALDLLINNRLIAARDHAAQIEAHGHSHAPDDPGTHPLEMDVDAAATETLSEIPGLY